MLGMTILGVDKEGWATLVRDLSEKAAYGNNGSKRGPGSVVIYKGTNEGSSLSFAS